MKKGKAAVVYWTESGGTEQMARAIARGIRRGGMEADLYQADEFSRDKMDEYAAVAFGCPAMLDNRLEHGQFEPMFWSVEDKLKDRKICLFGCYGQSDRWMKDWVSRCLEHGAEVLNLSGLICKGYPSEAVLAECETWGQELAL